MIYLTAIVFSLIVCAQSGASAITSGNITHLKYGREPNAGVSLFPAVPLFQLLALGLAWVLQQFVPSYAILVLVCFFLVSSALWLVSFNKLRAELSRAKLAARRGHNKVLAGGGT